MNPRGRYPPGIGNGRGGNPNINPNFQGRNPHQQYVQRNPLQNQQHQFHQQQHQQQWLRRNPMGADPGAGEVEKAVVLSEGVDSR